MTKKEILIWGDIHGCKMALLKAIDISIKLNIETVFLGDYIDRGPDSVGCLESLISAKKRHYNWKYLMGNHEEMLLNLLQNPNLINSYSALKNGDNFSYLETSRTYQAIMNSALDPFEIKSFLSRLLPYYQFNNWTFVHSALKDNTVPVERKLLEDLLWNHDETPEWTNSNFVHGHIRVNEITKHGQGININTSCGFGGKLSGIVIDIQTNEIIDSYHISEDGQILDNN
jgi:serine/threonine protein phosphatase 1